MSPKTIQTLLSALARKRVQFVLFGMEGLNVYAERTQDTFSTQDSDFLINSKKHSPASILRILRAVKWPERIVLTWKSVGRAPVTLYDGSVWKRLRNPDTKTGTLTLYTPNELYHVDLAFGDCGIPFNEVWKQSCRATFLGTILRVAAKEHIIESKRRAGRDKDKIILMRLGYLKAKIKHTD